MEDFKYLIPEESIDVITNNVATWRNIESDLRTIFFNHQYAEVLMPSFEYVDLYTKIDSGFTPEKMFQYINHEGKNVAMRCDFTIPLARHYASTKTTDVARFCYFGKVYRKEAMHKGRNSEFYQCGVELINRPGLLGDKECVDMIQESLPKLKLKNVVLELGSAKFFNRLCYLVGDQKSELTEILKFRNISQMKQFVKKNTFSSEMVTLLLQLPTSFGDISMLEELIEAIQDQELHQALTDIKELYLSLDNKDHIIFDLGMVPTMKYYTGVMIKGYTSACAYPILSGGRYDDLLPRFDRQVGAIGFCYHMNYILDAIEVEGEDYD